MEDKTEIISFLKGLIKDLEESTTEIEDVDINISFDNNMHEYTSGKKLVSENHKSIKINLDIISYKINEL